MRVILSDERCSFYGRGVLVPAPTQTHLQVAVSVWPLSRNKQMVSLTSILGLDCLALRHGSEYGIDFLD